MAERAVVRMKGFGLVLAVWAAVMLPAGCTNVAAEQAPEPLIVSTAANLSPAFEEIAQAFQAETGLPVTLNVGSTGKLAQQIEQGAPVDIFAAASPTYVRELEEADRIDPGDTVVFARGRITLWTRSDSDLALEGLRDLVSARVTKVVIANPEHAPYGVAAREALQAVGVWDAVQPKLVYGANVMQALQIAESGNVDAGILALSLSLSSNGRWVLVPEELHTPLDQVLGVVKGAPHPDAARQFVAFVTGETGQAILSRYGFVQTVEEVVP